MFWFKKNIGSKTILGQKKFGSEKFQVQIIFWPERFFRSKKILGPKIFWDQKIFLGRKFFLWFKKTDFDNTSPETEGWTFDWGLTKTF